MISGFRQLSYFTMGLILSLGTARAVESQRRLPPSLLLDTAMLRQIKGGVDDIYNYEFRDAEKVLAQLRVSYPEHPVTPFFEGLIYYWKYDPLIPEHTGSAEFEHAMEESWKLAGRMKEAERDPRPDQTDSMLRIEGTFFELMARLLLVMYYADNGKASRAIGHLSTIYRDILQGFEMQQDYKEFYFVTGLYDYYRDAYPKYHPVYKPAAIFFRKGDREKGLKMLSYAARETDFMQAEASLFLAIIYINYENRPDSALWYVSRIHRKYPGNSSFLAFYAEMLLANRQYDKALEPIRELIRLDGYYRMEGIVYRGMYEERSSGNAEAAYRDFELGLKLAEPYGEIAELNRAYAYMGLSRYYSAKGDPGRAREYYKKARNCTSYRYVLE